MMISVMNLKDTIHSYMNTHRLSIKDLAERSGISYPTMLNIVKKGNIPRKPQHRESLREALELNSEEWATILSHSGRHPVDLPEEGPMSLQQLVTKELYQQGYSEQSFAQETDIPYPTISGITRKGAIPRQDTLTTIIRALELDPDIVDEAIAVSKSQRRGMNLPEARRPTHADVPSLATLINQRIQEDGKSIASFARQAGIGYLTAYRMVSNGTIPEDDQEYLESLREFLGLGTEDFAHALRKALENPEPVEIPKDTLYNIPSDANPLQKALIALMNKNRWTIKAIAKQCDLSQITMAKLVKGQALPSRIKTHEKLQDLLDLDQATYLALIAPRHGSPHPGGEDDDDAAEDNDDAELEELIDMVRELEPGQRHALRQFLSCI